MNIGLMTSFFSSNFMKPYQFEFLDPAYMEQYRGERRKLGKNNCNVMYTGDKDVFLFA